MSLAKHSLPFPGSLTGPTTPLVAFVTVRNCDGLCLSLGFKGRGMRLDDTIYYSLFFIKAVYFLVRENVFVQGRC
jgi:hypothetical protein